jgi:hypothetical protein
MTSSLDSAIKNLDITLQLEIPLGPLGLCNFCPNFSLALGETQFEISPPPPSISGTFTMKELEDQMTGNLPLQLTTGDQVP